MLQHVLSGYEVHVTSKSVERGMRIWPKVFTLLVPSAEPFVRKVHVRIDLPMQNLAAEQFSGNKPLLSLAHSLEVYVNHQHIKKNPPKVTIANIIRPIQYLQELAPDVKDILVTHTGEFTRIYDYNNRGHYTTLVRLLLDRFPKKNWSLAAMVC